MLRGLRGVLSGEERNADSYDCSGYVGDDIKDRRKAVVAIDLIQLDAESKHRKGLEEVSSRRRT
jgi:hypothetical protein